MAVSTHVLTMLFMASFCSAQLISIPVNDSTVIIRPCPSPPPPPPATQQQMSGAKEAATSGHHAMTMKTTMRNNRCPVEKVRVACLDHSENVDMVKKQCCPVLDRVVGNIQDCLCSIVHESSLTDVPEHQSKMTSYYIDIARSILKTCVGTRNNIVASLVDEFTCNVP